MASRFIPTALSFVFYSAIAIGVMAAAPQTRTPQATAGAGNDQAFVRAAAQGGHGEVALAKLAQDHAKDERVKTFATILERDHSKANKDLSDLADQKTIHLSSSDNPSAKATEDRLAKLQGAAFDRAYIAEMVRDHQKDVAEFEKAGRTLSDPDVKAFVQQTLPTLKSHLAQALQLQKDIK